MTTPLFQHEKIIVVDFGSQYTQLIGRRVRELNVYSEIVPFTHFPEEALQNPKLKGVILSGSPFSVHQVGSPRFPLLNKIRAAGLPVLAICYGAQLIAHENQGKVVASQVREYGRAELEFINTETPLFQDINFANNVVWMSHGDSILEINNENFEVIARTHSVPIIAYQIKGEKTYGLQFHPEVHHSACGTQIFLNFIKNICKCSQDWTPKNFIEEAVQSLKEQVNKERVVMALSGGVDSSVAAALLQRAIGDQLFCIFVDNGLLRKDEYDQVLISYKVLGLNIKGVDAKELFYSRLAGVSDPEQKRKIIGKTFIDVFDKEAHSIQNVKFLGQGTIYPDVIESVSVKGPAVTIKSHHNVGGLPEKMNLKVVEPLRLLFKDEVRRVGKELRIPENILHRHPFPGPGLAIRILGDITPEKVKILQQVDDIFISGLKEDGLYDQVWQAGAILLNAQSVGVMGDERTYENVVALRAVNSVDGMTADWSKLPFEFLGKISNKIINQVKGVNRVCYDISSKPPATIEWE